jgi:putative nucleotidyltransferase with HDIG domain
MLQIGAFEEAVDPAQVLDAAAGIGLLPGLTLERRRARLLRAIGGLLGPAQLEHTTVHCEHVSRIGARLASLMRLPPDLVEQTRLIGLLHDIGKAMVPDELLGRAGPLRAGERSILAAHAAHGAAIARALNAPPAIVASIRAHHDDLSPSTPVPARIVRVADALAVMTTGRPYSAARTFAEALAELRRGRGRAFDEGAVIAAHIHSASVMALAA